MRYALRNQDKIKAYFEPNGDEMLDRIKRSLDAFFKHSTDEDLEVAIEPMPGERYPHISVNDLGDEDRMICFWVVGKRFDVYTLAFERFTKG